MCCVVLQQGHVTYPSTVMGRRSLVLLTYTWWMVLPVMGGGPTATPACVSPWSSSVNHSGGGVSTYQSFWGGVSRHVIACCYKVMDCFYSTFQCNAPLLKSIVWSAASTILLTPIWVLGSKGEGLGLVNGLGSVRCYFCFHDQKSSQDRLYLTTGTFVCLQEVI